MRFNIRTLYFSVIIPAYNEAKRLPPHLAYLRSFLAEHFPDDHEIIVVDDGSTDETAKIASELIGSSAVLRLSKNEGKGVAVRTGMQAARGKLRLFTDADGATPISELPRLLQAVERGADIAVGSRAAPGGTRYWLNQKPETHGNAETAPEWHVHPHRHLLGRVFSRLVMSLTGLPLFDTQCGFKLFRAEAAETLFGLTTIRRFAFDVEVLYLAQKLKLTMMEVPVSWRDVEGSKVRLLQDSLRMAIEVIRLRWRHRQNRRVSAIRNRSKNIWLPSRRRLI